MLSSHFSEYIEAYKMVICFYSKFAFLILSFDVHFVFMFWLKFRNYAREKLQEREKK